MFVERVLLRHIADVVLECVEVRIKRLSVEDDLAAGRLKLPGKHSQEGALSRTTCAHHANELAASDSEGNSLEADFAVAEAMRDFIHLERANDIALFLNDSFRKIATKKLSDVDSNGIAILQRRGCAHGGVAHQDWAIGFDHLQQADPLIVIAKNLQQHIAARPR